MSVASRKRDLVCITEVSEKPNMDNTMTIYCVLEVIAFFALGSLHFTFSVVHFHLLCLLFLKLSVVCLVFVVRFHLLKLFFNLQL